MIEQVVAQRADIQRLRAAFGKSLRIGPVAQVDAQKGYRVELGKTSNGGPFLSPWLPHPESGGQSQSWMPLSVGQIVGVLAPAGDLRQAMLIRAGFGGDNQAPSDDLAANLFKALGVAIQIKDGKLELVGDLTVKGNLTFEGPSVTHNGVNIGEDHKHQDVEPGSAQSGEPV